MDNHISLLQTFGEIQDILAYTDDECSDGLIPYRIVFKSGQTLNIVAEESNTGAYPLITETEGFIKT